MTTPTTPQESYEKRFDSLNFVEQNILSTQGRQQLKALISSERLRLLGEVRDLIKRSRVAENWNDVKNGLTAYDSSLLGTSIPNARNQALEDLLKALSQLEEEQK